MNADSIFRNFIKLGVNLTDIQKKLLEWRLSTTAGKLYSDKENELFYKAVKSGDTNVIDVIRKEKQEKIKALKKLAGLASLLFICFSLSSCTSPKLELNADTLKTSDMSYSFKNQALSIDGSSKPTTFNGQWYVVNSDYIKEHNENQNDLTSALEANIQLKNKLDKQKTYAIIFLGVLVCLVLLWRRK
jgi:hypothetical protein